MKLSLCIGACITLIALTSGAAEVARRVKTWNFSLPHGTLGIGLRAHSNGTSILDIGPGDTAPTIRTAYITEQVEPLKQVLAEMAQFGLDPRKVTYLGTRIFEEDVSEKLAYACADSEKWRLCMRQGGKGKERLVVELLNQCGAYEAYNEAFKPYGIRLQVTDAESVGLMYFSQVPARNARDRANRKMWVPADAALGLRFSPINPQGDQESRSR